MLIEPMKLKSVTGAFALALLAPLSALHAATPPATNSVVASARTFVETMAQGHFEKAEARFTSQMKRAAPPYRLQQLWASLVRQNGAFQKVGDHELVTVIVKVVFKNRPVDLAVTFDSAHRIAGVHLAPPPGGGY